MKRRLDPVEREYLAHIDRAVRQCQTDEAAELATGLEQYRRLYRPRAMDEDQETR